MILQGLFHIHEFVNHHVQAAQVTSLSSSLQSRKTMGGSALSTYINASEDIVHRTTEESIAGKMAFSDLVELQGGLSANMGYFTSLTVEQLTTTNPATRRDLNTVQLTG